MILSVRLLAIVFLFLVASVIGAWWLYDRTKTYDVLFGAGKIGNASFEVATALKTVLAEQAPSLNIEVLETEGTAQSLDLLQRGLLHLAAIQADYQIPDSVRLVARLYPDAYQVVVLEESEIQSILDFKGRRVAVSTSSEIESLLLATEHFGLLKEDFEIIKVSESSARWALLDGAIDAIFSVEPPGSNYIHDLTESGGRLVSIPYASAIQLKHPALEQGVIPAGSYHGEPPLPDVDLATVIVPRLLVARYDVDPKVVESFTEVLFERQRKLSAIAPVAGFVEAPKLTGRKTLPIHPGAVRFFSRDKPTFLQENAEPIALIVTLVGIVFAAVMDLNARRRKRRLFSINRVLLGLDKKIEHCTSEDELKNLKSHLNDLVGQVDASVERGRISQEGFEFFSFTWQAVSDHINNKAEELAKSSNPAGKNE